MIDRDIPERPQAHPTGADAPSRWYRSDVGIVLLLLTIWPIGVYLMWRYAPWSQRLKRGISVGIVALFALSSAALAAERIVESRVSASRGRAAVDATRASGGQEPSGGDRQPGLPAAIGAATTPSAELTQTTAPTATPRPTATPTPKPTPTPTPVPQPSPAWLDPEGAIIAASGELGWSSTSILTQMCRARAFPIRNLYPLVTADVGSYNLDTQGFYSWVKGYLVAWTVPAGQSPFRVWAPHAKAQVKVALQNPGSPIARRMRIIAAGQDPLRPGLGPQAYWDYLLAPYRQAFLMTPRWEQAFQAGFAATVDAYRAEAIAHPNSTVDFATFLAHSQFFAYWFGD